MPPLNITRIATSLLILGTALPAVAGEDDLPILLDGVAEVAVAPGVPGALCVYGREAFPVIVGAVKASEDGVRAPVVAAASMEAGRVVAAGSLGDLFLQTTLETANNGRLMKNALHWAAGMPGPSRPRIGVEGNKELRRWLMQAGYDVVQTALTSASLRTVDVVAVTMWDQSELEVAALSAFVRAGGGLVAQSAGWWWAERYPDLDLAGDFAGNRLLAPAGIQWTGLTLDRTSPLGFTVDGPPHELTHVGKALDAVQANALIPTDVAQATYTLSSALRSLPPDDMLIAPRLRALLESSARRWPSADHPVGESDLVDRLAATLFVTEHLRAPPEFVRAHPAAADFPGSVPADAPRLTRTLTIDASEPVGHATSPWSERSKDRWHSTGLYAAPGEPVTVTMPAAVVRNGGLGVHVGAHSEEIWNSAEWTRMPVISRRFPVSKATTPVANAFGGLIYIEVPLNANLGRIPVTVAGAVAAPLFVLGETDPAAWRNEIRHAPGPWAEIAGRNMIVTTDAREVRGLDDPAAVAETWDRVLDLNAELAAWPSPARLRPERFVVDRQLFNSQGEMVYMEAGYPIEAHLDQQANVVDVDHMRTQGNWGIFHEVGHNHQSSDWTFDGTLEVVVNLFTLYVYEFLCGIPVAEAYHQWVDVRSRAMIARYDFDNPDFELWKREPALALLMYVQLQEAFGWDAYRQVFATYRALPDAERPKSDDEKRDQWLVRFSRQLGRNLGPFFEAWGVPTSQAARVSIADMPVWLPPESPSRLEIISGDGQQGAPGEALAQPLIVEVRDQYGNPLPDAGVTFKVTAGEGKLSGRFTVQQATTDASGRAGLPLTLGLHPGSNTVVVSISGRELATFKAQGVGTAVAELNGDYRTWHLPAAATVRLGKGALGQSDRAVALAADGRCLAVASAIGVWLYESATSRALALLSTESPVQSVAFSLDGTLASGLDNGTVELWNVETGRSIGTLRHADWGRVTAVVFSRDGTTLATGSREQVIKLWDVETRSVVGTWEVPREDNLLWSLSVAFSPDGSTLVSGFQDGTVRLWDVATQTEVATLEGHTDRVTSVSFSPDGSLLASGGGRKDPTVRLWDVETRTEVATLRGHTGAVLSVSFSPDGAALASGSRHGTVQLWDPTTQENVANYEENGDEVSSVTFSPDGANLVSGATDGTVLLRDLKTGNAAGMSGHRSLSSMAFSPDGTFLASGYKEGTVRLWDATTGAVIATLNGHTHEVNSMSFSPDDALLASGSGDRTVRLWDVGTQDLIGTLEGHSGAVFVVSFSPDGARLASGSPDRTVKLWDVTTRELIDTLEGHTEAVYGVSFSHDSAILASAGGADKTVKLWDVRTRNLIETLEGHQSPVDALSFSPDGRILASGSHHTLKLWKTGTWEPIGAVDGRAAALSFSHDGTILAIGSSGEVRLWNVASNRMIATLEGHTRSVHSVAFSDDGNVLATGASDGTMLLWDVEQQLSSPIPNADFDGDGTVGFSDFVQFAGKFGLSQGDEGYDARFDLDGNGAIGFSDFLIFAGAFGKEAT